MVKNQLLKRQNMIMNGGSEQNIIIQYMDVDVTKNGFKSYLQQEDLK